MLKVEAGTPAHRQPAKTTRTASQSPPLGVGLSEQGATFHVEQGRFGGFHAPTVPAAGAATAVGRDAVQNGTTR